jgi:O-Antigen ligase
VVFMTALVALKRWKSAALLLGVGVLAYAALLPLNPYLVERIYGPVARNPIAAEYKTPWNDLRDQPGRMDSVPLTIHNTGISTWRSSGLWRASLGCRWWDMDEEEFTNIAPLVTALPHNVGRDETIEVSAVFRTPDKPGRYLLVFGLFTRNFDWFSTTGVIPLLIRTDIMPGVGRIAQVSDISALYKRGPQLGVLTAKVTRGSLWRAALKIFASHPLGIGPDNYRLEYGKYLGATRWDTRIYSNNLYLEILVGSGIIGLTAFLFMLARRVWRNDGASLGAGVFLFHGVVDVFLMTTPIYFAFWMFLGMEEQ